MPIVTDAAGVVLSGFPQDLCRVVKALRWKCGCVQTCFRDRIENRIPIGLGNEIGLLQHRREAWILTQNPAQAPGLLLDRYFPTTAPQVRLKLPLQLEKEQLA